MFVSVYRDLTSRVFVVEVYDVVKVWDKLVRGLHFSECVETSCRDRDCTSIVVRRCHDPRLV